MSGIRNLYILLSIVLLQTNATSEELKQRNTTLVTPQYCLAEHDIGRLGLGIMNRGAFGDYFLKSPERYEACHLGGFNTASGEYPRNSGIGYLSAASLWIGAVVGRDTLVSTAFDGWFLEGGRSIEGEMHPDEAPWGTITQRSTSFSNSGNEQAVSEQDFIASYTDTIIGLPGMGPDFLSGRMHAPLGLKVEQKSYAWSVGYADDFVLFDMTLENIGQTLLEEIYVGWVGSPAAYFSAVEWFGTSEDDLCGFLKTYETTGDCRFRDTFDLVWLADNDGDPVDQHWVNSKGARSCTAAQGLMALNSTVSQRLASFNWWFSNIDPSWDFGPRSRPTPSRPFRDFQTGGLGTPMGDANKYYQLSNHEMDYDLAYTGRVPPDDPNWLFPPLGRGARLAQGCSVVFMIAYGPFRLFPGEQLPMAFAYIAGDSFHTDPTNGLHLANNEPDQFYAGLSFQRLITNTRWAEWVYDNPGVDTDSDGYAGEYRVCVLDSQFIDGHWVALAADTTWYKGDGIPDWRAVQPPPAPTFWLEPTLNGIRVRFNGQRSETTKDIFSGIIDFEGYRIYMGRDEREASLALAASYDRENYDIFVWNPNVYPSGDFEIQDIPVSLQELRCRFGTGDVPCADSSFEPLAFTRSNPWRSRFFADSLFYFVPHENNASRLGVTTRIRRVYPDALPPGPTDTVTADDLTPEGYLKCYEYECLIEHLLPTVSYYVNVTAFDFGSPEADLAALETSKLLGVQSVYPFADATQSDSTLPPVYIYPNPYRYNAHYRDAGFEGRASNRIDDRERRVHFVNVPSKCTIRIHTLDGDLVRELRHDDDPSDPNSHHETWDLINRNVQPIVSGLYYWSVEATDGSVQMGKLVVIQ